MTSIETLKDVAILNGHSLYWRQETKDWMCSGCEKMLFTPHLSFIWSPLTSPCGTRPNSNNRALKKYLREIYNEIWV